MSHQNSLSWNQYVERNRKVMLFVSDHDQKNRLRQEVDSHCPKADVVIVASLEKIITGQKCHDYVMVRVA